MKYDELQTNISGIYKINFPNGKIYIGRARNIKRRIWEHFAKTDNTSCQFALKKYYKDYKNIDVDVLEQISTYDHNLICTLEKKYIQIYNATDKSIGYNRCNGGEGADIGVNNVASKISEEDLKKILTLLKEQKTNVFIGKLFNLHPDTIGRINTGKHYYNPNIDYPVRKGKGITSYYEKYNSFSNEQLDEALFLLSSSELSRKQIKEQTGISEAVLTNLNTGKHPYCKLINVSFPIRTTRRTVALTDNDVINIKKELLNPDYSMLDIANHFNCSRDTISDINKGKRYWKKDEFYPIRNFYPKRGSKKPVSTILESEE